MFLSKRQNGIYYLYITDENTGKRKMISCNTKYKPEAMKFLSNFKTKSKNLHKKISANVLRLSDLQNEVLKYVSDNLRKSTCQIYIRVFNDMLRIISNKPWQLIRIADIENYKSLRLKEVAQTTVNIELTTIKAIFNYAIWFNWINVNPCISIKKLSIPQKERLCFNDIEIKLILSNSENLLMKRLIKFALLTGCRLNEIWECSMERHKFSGIDFEVFQTKIISTLRAESKGIFLFQMNFLESWMRYYSKNQMKIFYHFTILTIIYFRFVTGHA